MAETIFGALQESAAVAPDNALIVFPKVFPYAPDGLEWTYAEVLRRVADLAVRYEQAGYGLGHRVALLLENRPEYFVHLLALNAVGVSVVPVNPDHRHASSSTS